jgi:hypothetical protein
MFEQGVKFNIFLFGQNLVTWQPKKKKGLQILQCFVCRENKNSQYLEKEKEKLNLPDCDHSF